jgi:type I restriction enzyme S subunit
MTKQHRQHWKEVEFGELVTHSAFGPRFSGEAYDEDGNVATLRTTDLDNNGRISYETMPRARLNEDAFSNRLLQDGDLVITRSGTCGIAAVFHSCALPVLPGAFLIRFRLNQTADSGFFRYYFNSPVGRANILSVVRGAVQQNLNITNVELLRVPLPPREQQESITSILSAYDAQMENNRRRMGLLEKAARLLYEEWFVRLRFPGQEHIPITQGLPQGWEKRRVDAVAEVNRASLPGSHDGEIEYVDISAVVPGQITETSTHEFRDAPSRARRIVQHGDIIWSCVRPNRRSHAVIWNPPENLIVSTGFAVITPTAVPTSFLYFATTTDAFVGYLENHAKGAAYPAVVAGDFERAGVVVPMKQLLKAFDEIVEPMLSQIHNLRLQNQELRAARDLLLPRLMSGALFFGNDHV